MKNLVDELLELSDPEVDKKIIKSFELKDHLCPEIFEKDNTGQYVMKKEIIDKLIEITDSFIDFTGVDFFVHDVILIGSLANYNWSEYSDVDLHILVDMNEMNDGAEKSTVLTDIVKEFFDAKKDVWNKKNDIKIKNFDVEIYVQDVSDEYVSSGVYSVLNNEWVAEPSLKKEDIDSNKILEKGEYFAKKIDQFIEDNNNGIDVSEPLSALRDKIKKFRKSGLESGGEYSYENLTFKLLRRNGYIEKLMDLRNSISNKKLSLP
jgi:predicted nucleotidyltransferase